MRILIELWLRPLCQGIIGTTAALLGIGLASAAGSVASGVLGSNAAKDAAKDQSQTALQVAQLQSQDANKALDFQKSQYNDAVARMQPWLRTGSGATNVLDRLLGMSPSFLNSVTPGTPSQTPPPTPATPNGPGNIADIIAQIRDRNGGGVGGQVRAPNQEMSLATSPSFGGPGGGAGMLQTGPDGQPTGVTKDVNPLPSGLPLNVTNASTNQDGSGQVPQTGGPLSFNLDPNFRPPPGEGGFGFPGEKDSGGAPFEGGPNSTASNGDTTGLPDGFLSQIWNKQFQAPTAIDEQNDPGYQARLRLGGETLERSAAARGNLLTGGEAKNLDQFSQDYASNEYANVYNRYANQFSTNYNIFKQNQNDIFNRYATLAGYGQTAAGQLNNTGVQTAGQVGNTLLTSGAQIGSDLNTAAAARGSGYVGSTNAITGAINGGINSTMDLLAMYQAMQKHA